MRPERWFCCDDFDFEAREFTPLGPYRPYLFMDIPRLWCRVHYELADDQPIIEPGPGWSMFALDDINRKLDTELSIV